MKKMKALVLGVCLSTILLSCSKENAKDPATSGSPAASLPTSQSDPALVRSNSVQLGEKVFVTYSGGQYISSFQGGITFGATLPHPTDDPSGIYDGYPIPTIDYVNWTINPAPCPTTVNGQFFTILEPTFPSSVISNTEQTLQAYDSYFDQIKAIHNTTTYVVNGVTFPADNTWKSNQVAALQYPQVTATVTGGGGIKTVTGQLIRDHLSPTKMSVISEKYVPSSSTSSTKVVGVAFHGAYRVTCYAPSGSSSGPVTSVLVTSSGVTQTVASFSINYTNPSLGVYQTIGSITLQNGTVIVINDTMES
ncbi:hypothetical protein [Flavihumibacter petaseus]|uniref:Lipoprotein n=1 Tax=Flavihumibacter petaseus NBRC 106054 TaxID=1220578 RepID=A0A0E9N6Z6_9BACT|nr:hypothetical protein [Flavihumibacter petaseus]GAO45599.1 hypothetical protein FPE01S_06_00900 [Flavihumibacter petaseus NBRC 106054]